MDGTTSSFNSLGIPTNDSCNMFKSERIVTTVTVLYVLFLPIFFVVFWIGHKKWKNTTTSNLSPLDTLTLNLTVVEAIGAAGVCIFCSGQYVESINPIVKTISECMLNMVGVGQVSFHTLTCVDRYLAVVHPIKYLHLKKKAGVTITKVCVAVTWLCCTAYVVLISFSHFNMLTLILGFVLPCHALTITTYCSISVLAVLIRPGPGQGRGNKRRINKSKQTAFYTIMIIQATLLVKFVVLMLYYSIFLPTDWIVDKCVLSLTVLFFELPSSLMLPLLFLHREGKLPRFKTKKR